MSLKEWSDLHGEENDGSFTLRRLSPSEKWCDRCHCYVERRDAVRWTADGSFTHYLCPGCDTELWEPENNEELYTAEEIAEAKSRRTKRAADSFTAEEIANTRERLLNERRPTVSR